MFTIRELGIIKKSLINDNYRMVTDCINIVEKINKMLELEINLDYTYMNLHTNKRFKIVFMDVKHEGTTHILTSDKELIKIMDFNKINYIVEDEWRT
ncbi:MAG: hypothetical protein ACRCW9_04005 [Cetobacterium sp.]